MKRAETKTRYKISNSQTSLLIALFKYRFLTSDLLAALLKKDRSTIYERLAVLVDQGYVTKKYESTYRIDRRPASYYLAPAGIRYLKARGYERTQIHYKNKDLSESQIDEYYRYPRLSLAIHKNYPEMYRTISKYQLDPENYIKPMPWLLIEADDDNAPDFFVEYIPAGEPSWIIRRRINQHIEYADEEADYTYPYLLLVAGNDNTEKRIVKLSTDLIWDSEVYTTTEERLLGGEKDVWLRPHEVDWDEELEFHGLPLEFEDD
jgi:predicted transcriptional regulator